MTTSQECSSADACFCLILSEPETVDIRKWLKSVVDSSLIPPLQHSVQSCVGPVTNENGDRRFFIAGLKALQRVTGGVGQSAEGTGSAPQHKTVCLIIAIFWDGQSDAAKAELIQLRKLVDELPTVQYIFQAVNAKKGAHTLKENRDALVSSLRKKLPACSATTTPAVPSQHVDPSGDMSGGNEGANGNPLDAVDLSEAAVAAAIVDGQGECFILVAGQTTEEFEQRVAQLHESVKKNNAGCIPVIDEPREVLRESNGEKIKLTAQEFLVRQSSSLPHMELRIAVCGNVDSGKSTLTSVLTRGCRDDGRGYARAFVFNHKHEATTGRTSSVSENHLGLSSTGEVVNYTINLSHGKTSNAHFSQQVVSNSAKVLTLFDLAGHERYLKTTVLGMTRNLPDYACVVISANNGIQRMTKEHIALCLALKIPFFVVLTRIDSTPDNIRQETLANIHKLLKIPTVRKLPYPVRRVDDLVLSAKNLRNDRITPIFEVSNVSGRGLQELLRFLNLLPIRKDWRKARNEPREMIIDSIFFVTGVGTVVGGVVTQGLFHVNDSVMLGPDALGAYRPVTIKSIHVKGIEQSEVVAGSDAAFCLKKEKRNAIRKGNILADPKHPVRAYWQFEADVTILYHSTTIFLNYEPVIHSITVRQSARIVYVAQEVLRTGDRSLVRFHFLYRPEFMKVGQQLIFREGRTKGIGTVTKLIVESDKSLLGKKRK